MLAYVRPVLAYVGLGWAYVGPKLAHVGPMLAYVGPKLSHLGGYVGHMLGICWLSWAYVEDMFGNLSRLEASTHEMSIMPVRPARITDATLEKPSAFAFLHLRRVVLRYAQ